ncbi:hypothetical protein PV10_05712 [Exophiala mesophila]|uniref:Transcription factor domain-containing protein n=1 Tax=Exophiala mesophila TaxID=212818 RepID=A0A0D1XSL7_EXOME|nr:uncharacterized protein PV10_05712 [Exophiala mesophila]KIV91136.1 hypothetical protein PV10_05712 [Exophiala mesophila]
MIEHYMKVVSQEYKLLHLHGESAMLTHENPLRWSTSNKDSPAALEISLVFAISSALITRDLDQTMSNFSSRCIEDLQRFITKPENHHGSLDTITSSCTALCGLALCDMIRPSSGQLWDLLGRAWTMFEDLRDQYQSRGIAIDQEFQNLEYTLLKMESMTAIHFRRYSAFCAMYARSAYGTFLAPNPSLEALSVLISLHNEVHRMDHSFQQPDEVLESLIPGPLQVTAFPSTISIDSARLYIALHPLFTASDAFYQPNSGAFPSRLFHIVGNSACTIINHYALLNEETKIICVWMAAEQVLEAGLVWAVYIMSQRQSTSTAFGGSQPVLQLSPSVIMDPIIKVSTLLASFTARWRNGSTYARSWEIFVQMFWGMTF